MNWLNLYIQNGDLKVELFATKKQVAADKIKNVKIEIEDHRIDRDEENFLEVLVRCEIDGVTKILSYQNEGDSDLQLEWKETELDVAGILEGLGVLDLLEDDDDEWEAGDLLKEIFTLAGAQSEVDRAFLEYLKRAPYFGAEDDDSVAVEKDMNFEVHFDESGINTVFSGCGMSADTIGVIFQNTSFVDVNNITDDLEAACKAATKEGKGALEAWVEESFRRKTDTEYQIENLY
ncbi:MAG: hypothetical protein BA869_08425 [Desulfuromonadales bacterium C00003107]|nr:MAG: hypothetical protein BA869_08425 [Desulfuromonadales bacterium C00003107]